MTDRREQRSVVTATGEHHTGQARRRTAPASAVVPAADAPPGWAWPVRVRLGRAPRPSATSGAGRLAARPSRLSAPRGAREGGGAAAARYQVVVERPWAAGSRPRRHVPSGGPAGTAEPAPPSVATGGGSHGSRSGSARTRPTEAGGRGAWPGAGGGGERRRTGGQGGGRRGTRRKRARTAAPAPAEMAGAHFNGRTDHAPGRTVQPPVGARARWPPPARARGVRRALRRARWRLARRWNCPGVPRPCFRIIYPAAGLPRVGA